MKLNFNYKLLLNIELKNQIYFIGNCIIKSCVLHDDNQPFLVSTT